MMVVKFNETSLILDVFEYIITKSLSLVNAREAVPRALGIESILVQSIDGHYGFLIQAFYGWSV